MSKADKELFSIADQLLKLREQFEAERRQVITCFKQADELLDHAFALEHAGAPREEIEHYADRAQALVDRAVMITEGRKPS